MKMRLAMIHIGFLYTQGNMSCDNIPIDTGNMSGDNIPIDTEKHVL